MPASNYVQRLTLNAWLRAQTFSAPQAAYVALYTTNPTAADSGTEVSGGGYLRMPAAFSAALSQGNQSGCQNTTKIEFPEATAQWGKVAYLGVRDAATDGNLLYFTPLATALDVVTGTTPKFEAGAVTITLE